MKFLNARVPNISEYFLSPQCQRGGGVMPLLELPKWDGKHIAFPSCMSDKLFSEGYTTKKHTKDGKNHIQF